MTPLICDWRITATDLAMTLNGAACCLRLSALFRRKPAEWAGRQPEWKLSPNALSYRVEIAGEK